MDNDKYLPKNDKDSANNKAKSSQTIPKNLKKKVCSQEIQVNFQYDDEPTTNKYQPLHYKQHGKIYYDTVDILDQNRFKFIINMNDEGGTISNEEIKLYGNYSKYSNQSNSNVQWDDIIAVVYYSVNVYNCPICLEKKLVCPKITRCGHIFCWPCLINYYNYWTVSSINKKIPKCPLCQETIKINQIKFCDILHCVNYVSSMDNSHHEKDKEKTQLINNHTVTNSFHTHYITFNLIMKNKKAPILYNTYYDPDLEYYKKHHNQKDAFNFVPLENQEEFSFSRIFLTTPQLLLKRYNNIKVELEDTLNEELSSSRDEGRVLSLNNCLENINKNIKNMCDKNIETNTDDDDLSKVEQPDNTNSIFNNGFNNITTNINEGNSENINENYSTIEDELLNKNDKLDFNNFFYFYQEQFGDIYYLHPINYSILLSEYEKEEHLPTQISGKILEIEMHQTTPHLKNKYPFLNHLRIGSLFFFVEIDIKQIVSNHTLKNYHNILKERSKIRYNIKREEDYYDNYVQNLKAKEERKLSSEFSMMNYQKVKVSEMFKEEIGLNDENFASNFDRKESTNSENAIDKKENKLKALLEAKESINTKLPDSENLKREEETPKFSFHEEDFPEIKNAKIDSNIKISSEEQTEDSHTIEKLDEGSAIVKLKSNFGGNKANKKKKKFEEINLDLLKKIDNNQNDNNGLLTNTESKLNKKKDLNDNKNLKTSQSKNLESDKGKRKNNLTKTKK